MWARQVPVVLVVAVELEEAIAAVEQLAEMVLLPGVEALAVAAQQIYAL
jgi:hypothetical protein